MQEKRLRGWPCNEKRRGLSYGKNNYGFGSTGDEEEGQAKATTDGQNQGGQERERHRTRADAGPSCPTQREVG